MTRKVKILNGLVGTWQHEQIGKVFPILGVKTGEMGAVYFLIKEDGLSKTYVRALDCTEVKEGVLTQIKEEGLVGKVTTDRYVFCNKSKQSGFGDFIFKEGERYRICGVNTNFEWVSLETRREDTKGKKEVVIIQEDTLDFELIEEEKKGESEGDKILGSLREARALILDEIDSSPSRGLSIVLTEVDTAILWRQYDLQLKTPPVNEMKRERE